MYRGKAHAHWATIGGQRVYVDSDLEERVIRELHESGFVDRWHKPHIGITVRDNNYTPDIELSIELAGMSQRAIVEIKPTLEHFSDYVSRRMRGISNHYSTGLMYLYADREKSWYRIDRATGELAKTERPQPGVLPIKRLHKPATHITKKIRSHSYEKRFSPIQELRAEIEYFVSSLLTPQMILKIAIAGLIGFAFCSSLLSTSDVSW